MVMGWKTMEEKDSYGKRMWQLAAKVAFGQKAKRG